MINQRKKRRYLILAISLLLLLAVLLCACFLYLKNRKPSQWTVTQYGDPGANQSMFYTIEGDTGQLIVVDGGWTEDAEYVRGIIGELGNKVDYWILTHPHPDHIGAFLEIYAAPGDIKINELLTIDMDYEEYSIKAKEWDGFPIYERFLELTENEENITYLYQGDKLEIIGLSMSVVSAYDEYVNERTEDLSNDGSLMFRVEGNENSMLFCADVGMSLSEIILDKDAQELKADYLQMGHHGNGGLSDDFYRAVSPKVAFFDAPDWLMNNLNPATGEQASYTTPERKELLESMGAEIYSFSTAPNSVIIK